MVRAGVQKWCVFMNVEKFSFFNQPPFSVSKETIVTLMTRFPEHLGHCIIWQCNALVSGLWFALKYLLDENTVRKIVFVSGDSKPGSEVDTIMTRIVGADWRRVVDADCARGLSNYNAVATQAQCQADEEFVRQLSAADA
jgi:hypothetical protein